jgi:hypothetical protein
MISLFLFAQTDPLETTCHINALAQLKHFIT